MAKISDLSEELLVKILSFLHTRDAVSTSVLSKQWEFLWMWCPDLYFNCGDDVEEDFINRNLPLYKAPFINSLCLDLVDEYYPIQPETLKSWVETSISRCVRNLTICSEASKIWVEDFLDLFLPSSLYTCNSLVTLNLQGSLIVVDVPGKACLSSLKELHLRNVTYPNEDSLRLLLSCCPVLEDLLISRHYSDYLKELVIMIPSLRRLSLFICRECYNDGCVIVAPSLKYFKLHDERSYPRSYSIEHMPELEEAYISLRMGSSYWVDLLKSVRTVKRLSLVVLASCGNQTLYGGGIVFSKLESLKLQMFRSNWTKITYQLLKASPNLQVLDLMLYYSCGKPVRWISNQSLVPECLLSSLKTFKFRGPSTRKEEEKDFFCFIIKHARCLVSTSIET